MNAQEAAEKIDEMNTIIQSSNKILFSGKLMVSLGVLIFTFPLIGYYTQWLTFGHDFGPLEGIYLPVANAFFFWGLSLAVSFFFNRFKEVGIAREPAHPLIRKAFSILGPVCFSIAGIIIVFSLAGLWKYIYPMIFIILGLLFSIYGKFTVPAMVYIAWSYVFAGLLFIYLRKYDIPFLDLYFMAYHGLSYVAMGFFLMRKEKAGA